MAIPKYVPHYTLADYRQWEGDWELWNGVPVAMTPSPFGRHQKLATKVAHRLLAAIERAGCDDCEVAIELDWIIADDLVVRPDVVVCCGSDIDEYIRSPPSLVVEVLSQSTAAKDRAAKHQLYCQQGVGHYLIVDPEQQRIELHRRDAGGGYQQQPSGDLMRLHLHDDCTIELSRSNIFP